LGKKILLTDQGVVESHGLHWLKCGNRAKPSKFKISLSFKLETQFCTLIKLMMSREQLQPNPNNEGLDQGFLDLMEWN
ncbi:hypothetical protein MKW92_045452, partial [Papaver armeniacum]